MLLDLKAAYRELLKNRWFTCITVLTLALGIGANTAIFSVVNQLLLNPLPYRDADRIVYPKLRDSRSGFNTFPIPDFVASAWREQVRLLDGIEAFELLDVLASDENGARVLTGIRITTGLPDFLDTRPMLGRGFTPADAQVGAPGVVMLSYEAWQRDYGGTESVLGRVLTIDETPRVVIGVWPSRWESFARGYRPEVFLPLSLDPASVSSADFKPVEMLGRLPLDRSPDAVLGELDAILQPALATSQRRMFGPDTRTYLERPAEWVDAGTRNALLVLLAAVGLVLLVACANVANLLLARGASRARELSLRSALGASTWRLIRALISECLVLALGACIAGVALALATLSILVRLLPDSLSSFNEVRLDPIVLAFALGVAVVTALLFGIAPGLQLMSRNLGDALRHGASGVVRGSTGPRLRKLLVASQMAMSVVLLVSAGLLVRSIVYLQNVDVGFETSNLFSAELALPRGRYQEPASRDAVADQLLDRIRSMPGVAAATQAFVAPPNYVAGAGFEIRGGPPASPTPHSFNFVRPDYFSTLGIRFVEGRTFTAEELRSNTAIVINRAAAQYYWPDGGALGAEVRTGRDWGAVVGIVDNVVSGALTQARDEPQLYFAFQAATAPTRFGALPTILLIVRGTGDAAIAIASLRAAVYELDPEIALSKVSLTDTEFARTIDGPRFNMALLSAFAIVALLLSAVGVAGVIGYEVTERTHEIGVRMALGARTGSVRRLAMRHGLAPAFVGIAVGLIAALAVAQLARNLLYGVAPRDPLTFAGAVALLLLVAVGASWIPARRSTRVDPIIALRAD